MWRSRSRKANGSRSGGLGLLASAVSLAALVWLLTTSGGGRLQEAVARLHLYMPHALDVTQPPGLHGRVQKAGPIDLKLFYPRLREACYADRLQWTAAAGRDNLTEGELSSLQRFPCCECQVFVNHMYKIIYLRHAKIASTSMLNYFGQCSPDRSEETGCLRAWELAAPVPTAKDVAARPTYLPLANLSEAQVAELWDDYFVFTVMRNPFSRAVSQYRTCLISNVVESEECAALAEGLDWDSVCNAPLSLLTFCARHPDCCLQGAVPGVWFKLQHLVPMKPCVTTPDGRLAADFVVRQELLEEDMADLLHHLNARKGVPKLKLGPMRVAMNADSWKLCKPEAAPRHTVLNYSINQCPEGGRQCTVSWTGLEAKEEYCSVQDFYAGRHAHCKASIASHFADDLRLLYGDSEH